MWNPRYRGPTVHRTQQKKYWRENTNTRAGQEAERHGTGGTGSEGWGGELGPSLRWHQHLSWVSLSHLQDVFLQVEATGTCSTQKWQTLLYFIDNTEGFCEQFWLWFSNYKPSLEANSPLRCSLPPLPLSRISPDSCVPVVDEARTVLPISEASAVLGCVTFKECVSSCTSG